MLLVLPALWAVAAAVPTTYYIEPEVLKMVFRPKLEDITVRPTEAPKIVEDNGERWQCVPYYLCEENLNATRIQDPTITGYGQLDIRFKEGCQESVERLCKIPNIKPEIKTLPPDDSRLRGCGYRNVNGLDFTVSGGSGNEAQFGEFPWVVAILDVNDGYHGVGVLIHPEVVMTAAHIAAKFIPEGMKVRAGEWDTQTTKERLPFQESMVKEFRVRNDFCAKNLFNDVALLRLKEPFRLSDHINVACLPDQYESFDGYTDCVANGWGREKFGRQGSYAVIMKKVEVDVVPHMACNRKLKTTRLGRFFRLHYSFLCAGGTEGKDTCEGDGGAPLMCPVGGGRYKLAGLTSWGIGCGQNDTPGVYANVALFRNWVDAEMSAWGLQTTY